MGRIIAPVCLLLAFVCGIPASEQARKRNAPRGSHATPRAANRPPQIKSFTISSANVVLPCYCVLPGYGDCFSPPRLKPRLTAEAFDPDGDTLLYKYAVTEGRIVGEGADVEWYLAGVGPGAYRAGVTVDDQRGGMVSASTGVTVAECSSCDCPCPVLTVTCPAEAEEGQPVVFSASVEGGETDLAPIYGWTVSAGRIITGQGTPTVEVDTAGLAGQQVKATVEVGGVPPECDRTESCEVKVRAR